MRAVLRLGAACAALLVSGCSEAFDPRVPADAAFAIDGTLDGRRAVQGLRIQDLTLPVEGVPEVLPATVTSTELASGVTTAWADSLVRLDDGTLDHLFTAPLALRPGETHRIEARRAADRAASTVEISFPSPTLRLGPSSPEIAIRTELVGVADPPPSVRVRYRARLGATEAEVVAAYGVGVALSGPAVLLELGRDARRIRTALNAGTDAVELLSAVVEAEITPVRPQPVLGGLGAVGWVLPVALPLDLLPADIEAAGLVDARSG